MRLPGRFGVRAFSLYQMYQLIFSHIYIRALGGCAGVFLSNPYISLYIVVQEGQKPPGLCRCWIFPVPHDCDTRGTNGTSPAPFCTSCRSRVALRTSRYGTRRKRVCCPYGPQRCRLGSSFQPCSCRRIVLTSARSCRGKRWGSLPKHSAHTSTALI